jgi:hypothetical protein
MKAEQRRDYGVGRLVHIKYLDHAIFELIRNGWSDADIQDAFSSQTDYHEAIVQYMIDHARRNLPFKTENILREAT